MMIMSAAVMVTNTFARETSDTIVLTPENTEKEIYEPLSVKYVNMESAPDSSNLAQVLDIGITDLETIRVGLTGDYVGINYINSTESDSSVSETSLKFKPSDISIQDILDKTDEAIEAIRKEEEERRRLEEEARIRAEEEARLAALAEEERIRAESALKAAKEVGADELLQGGLFDISNPDPNYERVRVKITGDDREVLERLVMGEAGDQGFKGAALVAQCLKDMYIKGNYETIEAVRRNTGYTGSLKRAPNKNVLDAVAYVFDEGGYAVKHRILYFYAPSLVRSKWHETQNFIIEYKDHRVFDEAD